MSCDRFQNIIVPHGINASWHHNMPAKLKLYNMKLMNDSYAMWHLCDMTVIQHDNYAIWQWQLCNMTVSQYDRYALSLCNINIMH